MKRILLVEPDFPIPSKIRNHKDYLPIGLLKIAAYLRTNNNLVGFVRGNHLGDKDIPWDLSKSPTEIWITSLFTYWASQVRESVECYRETFPSSKIVVGGIYASLLPEDDVINYTGCDAVHQGVIPEVEEFTSNHKPAYDLIQNNNPHPIDYQIIHASRGCDRECSFCGVWKIEPEFLAKESISNEIFASKVVFYDNNFLMNPHIEDILVDLFERKKRGEISWVESQSGLDGRLLLSNPHLADLLKNVGFRYPRIAWDTSYGRWEKIYQQIQILVEAGFNRRDIFVFMLYNNNLPFEVLENKRKKCWEWKVQISDCRFRPLDQLHDFYNPNKREQTSDDYYIHPSWSDSQIRQFRRNVRRQNICVRYRLDYYSSMLERKKVPHGVAKKLRDLNSLSKSKIILDKHGIDYWDPSQ